MKLILKGWIFLNYSVTIFYINFMHIISRKIAKKNNVYIQSLLFSHTRGPGKEGEDILFPLNIFQRRHWQLFLLDLFIWHSNSPTRTQFKKYFFVASRVPHHFLIQLCNHFSVHVLASIYFLWSWNSHFE